MRRSRRERVRQRRLREQLPGLAATMARSAHSGATLVQAVEECSAVVPEPARSELVAVVAAVRRGMSVDDALGAWAAREAVDDLALVVAAASLGHRSGGDLAAALDAAAASLLDRAEVADEAHALSTQARTSAWVLVALPPVGAATFCLLDPRVLTTLLGTAAGWTCLVVGALLDGVAALVMRRMVAGALR